MVESPTAGFRVYGGRVTACAPNGELLNVMLHEPRARELIERITTAGGQIQGANKIAVPTGEWMGIPVARLGEFRDEVLEAHKQHLQVAIEAASTRRSLRVATISGITC